MVGGNFKCTRRQDRHVWLAAILMVAAAPFVAVSHAEAHVVASDQEPHPDCAKQTANEKSIVVAQDRLPDDVKNTDPSAGQSDTSDDSSSVVIATDRQGPAEMLEPIASVGDYVPDLAVPELADAVAESSDCHSAMVRVADATAGPTPANSQAASASPTPTLADTKPIVPPMSQPDAPVAGFNGVQPGVSTRSEVLEKWGNPSGPTDARVLQYQFDGQYTVRVHFDELSQRHEIVGPDVRRSLDGYAKTDHAKTDNQVSMIRIALDKPRDAESLIEQLGIGDLRVAILWNDESSVNVLNKGQAEPIALVLPERGIELSYLPVDMAMVSDESSTAAVRLIREIAIRPIEAAAFTLRAENNLYGPLTHNIQDLEQALELDSSSARANWLLSKIQLSIGKAIEAEKLAAQAVELAPGEDVYRLHLAMCLQQLARYDAAVVETRNVLEGSTAAPIVRAQALHQMGLLASLGSKNIAQRAVALHLKAIYIADRLAGSDDHSDSQAAKQLLIDAHLAVAVDIARGKWQQKDEYVPQWLARASALAEGMIASNENDLRPRLQVAVSALTAVASLDPPVDPNLWVREAEETAAQLRTLTTDELALQKIEWDLGIAYFQAAQIEHRRGQPHKSLLYGEKAEAKLVQIAGSRQGLPDTDHLLGRLYFQLGAIYAVYLEDHAKACQWYDQAAELLLKQVPVTSMAVPGRHGDALVSMGVSYWYTDRPDVALKLTQAGADLMEEAVAGGLLLEKALAVPYSNLASMYGAQGDKVPAARYAKLANKHAQGKAAEKRR